MTELGTVRVAAVQATPVILDAEASVQKAIDWIGQAAVKGAKLVVLPETFIPLYPAGDMIAGPLYDREGIVMADCDLRAGLHAKRWFDSVGHYSREDILIAEIESASGGPPSSAGDQDGSSSNSSSPTTTSSPGSNPAR